MALDKAPEFAAQIGILISCLSMVEFALPPLLRKLTGMDSGDAMLILGLFRADGRIEVFKALAANRPDPSDVKTALERLLPRIKAANTIRNKYAHAQYSLGRGVIVITPYAGETRRSATPEERTLDQIKAEVQSIKDLIVDLGAYVHQDVMPPP